MKLNDVVKNILTGSKVVVITVVTAFIIIGGVRLKDKKDHEVWCATYKEKRLAEISKQMKLFTEMCDQIETPWVIQMCWKRQLREFEILTDEMYRALKSVECED